MKTAPSVFAKSVTRVFRPAGFCQRMTRKSSRGAWRGLCKTHSFKDLHNHVHRHSYCTNLLLSGSTLMQTSVLVGHQYLRRTKSYSNLEGVMDSQPLEHLAKRYTKTSKDQ
ncbi:tyrosine-type recombinase/integrase [uncultured Pseudodesulfovibrio sp.]|uniref:tyrosine-type recombinase/integrase n=1 Tax=uncultured Pseudodesulfovibrio sp. TaxID=2035858 RepID=UPI0029C66063|nr:tyrosine-type recombinase/integrase [uncultured Pseudodesulfovibrio sp.]